MSDLPIKERRYLVEGFYYITFNHIKLLEVSKIVYPDRLLTNFINDLSKIKLGHYEKIKPFKKIERIL